MKHGGGLSIAVEWLLSQDAEFLCVMDSDAFPVRPGWVYLLQDAISRTNKKFAAPFRVEFAQLFPHPCFVFVPRQHAQEVLLNVNRHRKTLDVFGNRINGDVGSRMPNRCCFPMLRTNKNNIDPVLHAIYYDCVYHKGAGSRPRATIIDWYYRIAGLVNPVAHKTMPDHPLINHLCGKDHLRQS